MLDADYEFRSHWVIESALTALRTTGPYERTTEIRSANAGPAASGY